MKNGAILLRKGVGCNGPTFFSFFSGSNHRINRNTYSQYCRSVYPVTSCAAKSWTTALFIEQPEDLSDWLFIGVLSGCVARWKLVRLLSQSRSKRGSRASTTSTFFRAAESGAKQYSLFFAVQIVEPAGAWWPGLLFIKSSASQEQKQRPKSSFPSTKRTVAR